MQEVLSTSPIMSTRHQAASTPTDLSKNLKQEDRVNFYAASEHSPAIDSNFANAMAFHYRNNNFSVSNLANLNQEPEQRSWSYENNYKAQFSQGYTYPYQTYQTPDLTPNNFMYSSLPIVTPDTTNSTYNTAVSSSSSSSSSNHLSPSHVPTEEVKQETQSYQAYNQLSSSQISSSSVNTSQSSNKSLSPKAEFDAQNNIRQASQFTQQPPTTSLSPLSSFGVSNSSIGNLSSSSSNYTNQLPISANPTQSANVPVNSTESFEWMRPVKSQPNGKSFLKYFGKTVVSN